MNNFTQEVRTPSGKRLEELTLESVMEGSVPEDDFRITLEALIRQAKIADNSGRKQLAENFRRAAELTAIPDKELVDIYNALRPGRSTKDELLQWISKVKNLYHAHRTARLIRETILVYERRGLLCHK